MADSSSRTGVLRAACAAAIVAALAGVVVLFAREHSALARESSELQKQLDEGPVVQVAKVELAAPERIVALPAEVRAERKSTLYAKVSGYVKRIEVERGDKVKAGQLLAVLESPDLDEQVSAAQAEVTLRRQQAERARKLAEAGRVSQQEREQADEALKVSLTALSRAKAARGYQELRAPFDGTVTARFADPGALLPAATGSTTSAQPLLEVAQLDRLRVALNLAQDDAARVRVGDEVTIDPGTGDAPLKARISRLSQSLDARTRTMLCEIDLAHPPAGLYPGAFVHTELPLRGRPRPLVPAEALISQAGQMMVPLVEGNRVHFQRVKVGGHDGARVEVLQGLQGGETVALNLSPDVTDGAPVRPQQPAQAQAR